MNRSILAIVVVLIVGAVLFTMSAFTVHQSQTAIKLRLGNPQTQITEPGLYFKWPFIENVVKLDKRVLNIDLPATPSDALLTRDQKRILISAFVRYQIVDTLKFYQVGKNTANAEGQIRSVLVSTLRSAIGNIPMATILTPQRAVLMAEITKELTRQAAAPYGIRIVDVRFKRVDLLPENSEAIFNQMRTQRAQEAAGIRAEGANRAQQMRAEADKERVVTLAEAQRQASILRGQGDGEATRIYNEAYGQDPKFFDFYRSLEAMRQGLGGDNTTFVGTPSGDFFRFFGTETPPAPAK